MLASIRTHRGMVIADTEVDIYRILIPFLPSDGWCFCDDNRAGFRRREWTVALQPHYRRRTKPGDDHKVRSADAGHQFALAAAHVALGAGVRRHLSRQPAADLRHRTRPG